MKCPYCGGNPVIQEPDGTVVCFHCGGVLVEKPIDDSSTARYYESAEEPFSGSFTYRLHSKGIGETKSVNLRDATIKLRGKERLEVCLRKLYKYYGVLFRDECTLNEGARLLHVVIGSDTARTPYASRILDTLVRTVILIASRRCGREARVELLFPKLVRGGLINILSRVFKRFPVLREYYVIPRTRDSLRENIVRVVVCLENRGIIQNTTSGDIIKHSVALLDKLPAVRNRPSTIAALVYLSTRILGLKVTQRNIVKCTDTNLRTLQHALARIKRAVAQFTVVEGICN